MMWDPSWNQMTWFHYYVNNKKWAFQPQDTDYMKHLNAVLIREYTSFSMIMAAVLATTLHNYYHVGVRT